MCGHTERHNEQASRGEVEEEACWRRSIITTSSASYLLAQGIQLFLQFVTSRLNTVAFFRDGCCMLLCGACLLQSSLVDLPFFFYRRLVLPIKDAVNRARATTCQTSIATTPL